MRIINGRYRIDKLINSSRSYLMYEGVDIKNNKEKVNIYVLNSLHIEKNLLEICVNEFEKGSILNEACVNILEFGSTVNLSSKEKKVEYFYVTESISDYKYLMDVTDKINEDELLEVFVAICRVAQEQCYSYIKTMPFSVENMYISMDKKIKLKDKITALLDCRELGMAIHYQTNKTYNDSIFIENEISNEKYYIDKLKEILVTIVMSNKGIKLYGKIQQEIDETFSNEKKHEYLQLIGEKISVLMYHLYSNNSKTTINKIIEIIDEINKVFHTKYKFISNKKNKLNFKTPLIGRSEEVLTIVKSIDENIKEKNSQSVILIHGEIGIGKTKLVSHIKHLIDINYKNSLNCYYVESCQYDMTIGNLLKQVSVKADKSLLNKYKKELAMVIPEINGEEVSGYRNKLEGEIKNNIALMAKLALFLLEYFSNNQGVIILDNVHRYDNFTLEIIQYILNRTRGTRNLPVIITYRDGDCLSNYDFTEMLKNISDKVDVEIHLAPLNEEMTSRVLKNILNVDIISEGFTDILYRHSMGNPLLLEEGIKYLRNKKVIYMDKSDGIWKKISNHEIYMSTDMEEICRDQIIQLKEEYLEILYNMSYFYMPVNLSILVETSSLSKEKLNANVEYLVSKGILSKTKNYQTAKYNFYNKFLKNYLYRSINENISKKEHNKIVEVLMFHYENNKAEYIDEIIYQLEKIKDKRILEFYKERKKDFEKYNKVEEAIKVNFKILTFIKENTQLGDYRKEEIEVNVSLGAIYNKLSEKKTSIEYYLKAKNLCNNESYLNEYIDILREILFLSIDLGYEDNVSKYLKEMRAAVEKSNYRLGKIKYLSMIIWRKYNKQEYELVKELCNYGISLCEKEDEEYRLTFMNYYSDVLVVQGKEVEALQLLENMALRCEEINFNKRLCRVSNSLGVLYSDYLQYGEEALKWFEKADSLGGDSEDSSYKVNSLANLGFINYIMLNYDKAYEYFNNSSNRAMDSEVLSSNFYNFSYIGTILYKLGKYNESYRYANLCSHYINKDYAKYWQEAGPYCIFMYYTSDVIGDIEGSKKYLDQGVEILGESKSVVAYKILLLHNIYCLCYERSNSSVDSVIISSKKILYIDFRISMLCYCINKLLALGLKEDALKIYDYILSEKDEIKSKINNIEIEYLGVALKVNKNYKELASSLETLTEQNQVLAWKINFELAKGYCNDGNYTYAAKHIYECCGHIIDALDDMSNNYVESFIKANEEIIQAFELLIKIKKHYKVIKKECSVKENLPKVKSIILYLKGLMKQNIVNSIFLKELKNQKENYYAETYTLGEMLAKLNGDMNENLNTICQYINSICISSNTKVLVENDGEIKVIASTDEEKDVPDDLALINLVRTKKVPLILKDKRVTSITGEIISYDLDNPNKTIMCIPITQELKSGREANGQEYINDLTGYIYIESDKKINNFNINSLKTCFSISKILYLIIDRNNIRKSSSIDNLTSALMRKPLELFIQGQIEKSYNFNSEFSVIMLDIDKFKEINDNYGHRTGDKVLRNLCKTIFENIRKSDVVGRYGGEEFIIVLPNIGSEEAQNIAERIRNKIMKAKLMDEKRKITVSMGIASYPEHATTYDELIEKSDQALYEVKNSGRNRSNVWSESVGYNITTTNRLSGIFVGNGDQDYKNVSTVVEFIDLINEEISTNEKIINTINRITEITEAEICTLYSVKKGEINAVYSKNLYKNGYVDTEYNLSIVKSSVQAKENICGIDWNCIKESSKSMMIPDIKSNMVILLKNKQTIIGAIHLSASINHKEFNYDQLNYINTLGKIIVPMLEEF